MEKVKREGVTEDDDLGRGSLFATGLVAGGALAGVAVALLTAGSDNIAARLQSLSAEHGLANALGQAGYDIMGVLFFALMAWLLYKTALKKNPPIDTEDTSHPVRNIK